MRWSFCDRLQLLQVAVCHANHCNPLYIRPFVYRTACVLHRELHPGPDGTCVPLLLFGPGEEIIGAHLNIGQGGERMQLRGRLHIPAVVCGELEGGMAGVIALDRIGAAHLRFVQDGIGNAPMKVP